MLWEFVVNDATRAMHHDIEPMPNGNVLAIVWDRQTTADAIADGRDPSLLSGTDWLPDSILEIERTGPTSGAIVWEWHLKDHLIQDFDANQANFGVVANHPELVDINYPPVVVSDGDWNHANGLDYNEAEDWIVLSSRAQAEIYLIDHSTTTAEAAGHTGGQRGKGGDILWRWGNPAVYGAGTFLDQRLNGQHDPRFIRPGFAGEGNITVFNNSYNPGLSAVQEFELPLDASGNIVLDPATGRYGPVAALWTFTEPGFFSQFVSSAQRLANGNTLICSGMQKRLFEVTGAGQTVWSHDYLGTGILFQAHSVDRTLWSGDEVSIAGGAVGFEHRVDSSHAGEAYALLGSFSGTSPGELLPGGVLLPLNADFLTIGMLEAPNVGPFVDTSGLVSALGGASSSIVLPPGLVPPVLAGVEMKFATILIDASVNVTHVSNVTTVTLVP